MSKITYNRDDVEKFVAHIAPIMRHEADLRGYKIISASIAQAIIEGACGKSELARKYHNHFGMKASKGWQGGTVNLKTKEEYSPGTLTDITALWRTYESDEAGIKGYYDFLKYPRYSNLKGARDYKEFARLLKKDGWATSSTYVSTLTTCVSKYNLFVWDEGYKAEYYPVVTGYDSVIDALDSIGVDSSKAHRKDIYQLNFTDKYTYSAEQNTAMLVLLAQGRLMKI